MTQINFARKPKIILNQLYLINLHIYPYNKKNCRFYFLQTQLVPNVLIYFDAPTKQKVIKKVYDSLVPGGYLFIGKTETLDRDVVPFKLVGPAIYRK